MNQKLNVVVSAALGGLVDGMKKAGAAISQGVGSWTSELDKVQPAINNAFGGNMRGKISELGSTIREQKEILIEFEKQLAATQEKLRGTSKNNLAQQKALRTEIVNLKTAIKDQRLAVNELSNEKTALSGNLQDVRGKAEANTQAMEAMTRAVNAASMAVLLLGDANGELQPLVKAAQVTMALFGATVAITNLFTRENAVVTAAMANAQKAFAFVVGTSTGALKAFRIALAATGILAAVAAIGFAVEKLISMSSAVNELDERLESLSKTYEKFSGNNERLIDDAKREEEVLLAKAKVAKASEAELLKIKQDSLNKQLKLVRESLKKSDENQLEAEKKAAKEISDEKELANKILEIQKYYGDKYEANLKREKDIIAELEISGYNFQAEMQQKQADLDQKAIDEAKKSDAAILKANEKYLQEQRDLAISKSNLKKAELLSTTKDEAKIAQIILDNQNEIITANASYLIKSRENNQEEYQSEEAFQSEMNKLQSDRINAQTSFNDAMTSVKEKAAENAQKLRDKELKQDEDSYKQEIEFIKNFYAEKEALILSDTTTNKNKAATEKKLNDNKIAELKNLIQAATDAQKPIGELQSQLAKLETTFDTTGSASEKLAKRVSDAISQSLGTLVNNVAQVLGDSLAMAFEGQSEEAKIGIELMKARQKELESTMKDSEATNEERLRAKLEYLKGEKELLNMQESNLQKTFSGILLVVADFMDTLGKALIAAAIASETFQVALATNPPAAIAAGAALIGLAAITKSQLSKGPKFAQGGIVYGEVNNATLGEYANARTNPEIVAPLNKLKSLLGMDERRSGDVQLVYGETYIKGSDLALVLKKANINQSRG